MQLIWLDSVRMGKNGLESAFEQKVGESREDFALR